MGVLGLWQLLNPTSRPIKIESLEGRTLAVDISIWLYQATKGTSMRNGHISVLYNRICKLLYFKIKPVFVFDGPDVPSFKRRILVRLYHWKFCLPYPYFSYWLKARKTTTAPNRFQQIKGTGIKIGKKSTGNLRFESIDW
jgi:hypothetical protein